MEENQEPSVANPESDHQVEEQMIVGGVQSEDNQMETSVSGQETSQVAEQEGGNSEAPSLFAANSKVQDETTTEYHQNLETPAPAADQSDVAMETAQQPQEEQPVEEKIEEKEATERKEKGRGVPGEGKTIAALL